MLNIKMTEHLNFSSQSFTKYFFAKLRPGLLKYLSCADMRGLPDAVFLIRILRCYLAKTGNLNGFALESQVKSNLQGIKSRVIFVSEI